MKILWRIGLVVWGLMPCVYAFANDVKSYVESDLRYAAPGKEATDPWTLNRSETTAGLLGYFERDSLGATVHLKLSYFN